MYGSKFGLVEACISLAVFGMFTLFMRFWWWVFSQRQFPWKRIILGMTGLWAVLIILSLFGC